MAAFLLADVHVPDMEAYRQSGYLDEVPRIAARFGGVYRVRGGDRCVLEGGWHPSRLVIIEFPDMASLKAFFECPEYEPYRAVRQRLTVSKIVAVEGIEESELAAIG